MKRDRKDEEFESVLRVLTAPRLREVPAAWMERAHAWLLAREQARLTTPLARARTRASSLWREVRASLVLDTAFSTALQGIRSVPRGQPRQILFDSPAGQVQIRCLPATRDRVRILGQFLPAEQPSLGRSPRAILRQEGRETVRRLAPTGEFVFASAPPGPAELVLEGEGIRLLCETVDLSARSG